MPLAGRCLWGTFGRLARKLAGRRLALSLALACAAVLAARCGSRPAAAACDGAERTPVPIEGIPECSRVVTRLVFATRIDACRGEQVWQVLRRLDHINTAGPWLEYVGRPADVATLRSLGCPTAVLCTDANAYGMARQTLGSERFLERYRAALDTAAPPVAGSPGPVRP